MGKSQSEMDRMLGAFIILDELFLTLGTLVHSVVFGDCLAFMPLN